MEKLIGLYFIRMFQTLNHFSVDKGFQMEEGDRYYAIQHLAHFQEIKLSDMEDHSLGFTMRVVKQTKIDEILEDLRGFTERIKSFTKNAIRTELQKNIDHSPYQDTALHFFLDIQCWVKIDYMFDLTEDKLVITDVRTVDLKTDDEYYNQLYKEYIGVV